MGKSKSDNTNATTWNSKYKLVCYYTNWSQYRTGIGKFMPKDIDPNLCTHIVYAFGKLVGNKITNFEWNDNKWSNLYKQVNDLKLKNPNLKTLIAMGGWTAGSLAYSNMASTKANRKKFIESSIAWCRKYSFDGLDMDWEYPANRDGRPIDYDNFAHLCKETREAFEEEAALTGRKRLLFTSAVAAGKYTIDTAYNVPVLSKYMDFICIMAYDLHGSWERLTGLHSGYHASDSDRDKTLNVAFAADYWNKKGAPKEKLVIGLGTYGRSFTLASAANHGVGAPASGAGAPGKYTKEKGFLAYYEICEMQSSGQGTTYRDPKAQVPYYVNPASKLWVGFDDESSLRVKLTDLIIKQGYGGAMTWALPLDDFTGTFCGGKKYPLISLMKETLEAAGNGGVLPITNRPVTAGPTTPKPVTVKPSTAKSSTQAPIQTTTSGGNSGNSKYKLVCYYTNWSQYRTGIGKFMPKDIDPNLCTHIVYAFGKLVGNKITNFEWNDNKWSNLYKQVNDLKLKNPNLKTLLAMGGWTAGSLAYSNMASTKANRKEFIESSIAWCRKYNFDGLDMDWEYPANRDGKPQDYDNFAHLCKETREAFEKEAALTGRKRLLFTSAVAAGKYTIDTAYNVPVMAKYMDFICIMAYDLHGSWERFTGLHSGYHASDNDRDKTLNVAFAADYWNKKGAPKEKLIIGLGTYGRSFTLASAANHGVGSPASGAGAPGKYTKEKGFLAYYEICEMQSSGQGTTYRDPKAQVPYYVNPATKLWVGFDDENSLLIKLKDLIIKQGYGGAMTWALPLDDFTGTLCGGKKYPLISLMKETLENNGGALQTSPKPITVKPSTAMPSTQAPVKTTTTGGNSGVCVRNGANRDPTDCAQYYECCDGKIIGNVKRCSVGLLFNNIFNRCDYANRVSCDVTGPTSAVPTTKVPEVKTTTPRIMETTSSRQRTTTKSGNICENKLGGLFPHSTDCNKYIQCNYGRPIVRKCGPGLHFNPAVKGCDWPWNAGCQ